MLTSLVLCAIGLVILTYAADKLVEGASNLAINIGVSKMVVGLTIVAAGTSLPELVVSVNASLKGNPAISLGNAVGSNIVNIALILGLAALIQPITCTRPMVRREAPIMIAVAGLAWYFAYTESIISPTEGLVLLALFIGYTVMSYFLGRRENAIAEELKEVVEEIIAEEGEAEKKPTVGQNIGYVTGGLIGLVIGAEALVRGSVTIAQSFGISDEIIGLTLIAIGTSLPELATSVVAARKGQSDIALGNVVGSNIFNILGILGCTASLPLVIQGATEASYLAISPNMLGIHIPLMVVVSLGVLPLMRTGMRIVRLEGAVLIAAYIAYSVMLYQTSGAEQPKVDQLKPQNNIEAPAQGNGQPGAPASTTPVASESSAIIPGATTQEPATLSADVKSDLPADPVAQEEIGPTPPDAAATATGSISSN